MNRAPDLDAAYRAARYEVQAGRRRLRLVIGKADATVDNGLRRAGCRRHCCMLTACNPGSRLLRPEVNRRRLQHLRELARRRGWRSLPSLSSAPDGRWREPGLCLLDVAPAAVMQLARHLGQAAWVLSRLGSKPQLIWTGPEFSRDGRCGPDRGPAQCGRGCAA